jgi:citrate synthase
MEQLKVGKVIRPRGRYTGPALEEVNQSPSSGNGSKTLDPVTLDKNRVFKTIVR